MTVRLLADQDMCILEEYLFPYKTQCMFILSNLRTAGIDYKGQMYQGEYFGYFSGDAQKKCQLCGVIVHYWNGNVMMCAPNRRILKSLVAFLKPNASRSIEGVLGENTQAEYVIKELGLSDALFSINSNEKLYELFLENFQKPELPTDFNVVSAQEIPKEILLKWMQAYDAEALGISRQEDHDNSVEYDISQRLKKKNTWVLLAQGVPVSLSAFNARIEDMVQVGPVWTPPEYRNKHFARMLLAYTLYEEKEKGIQKAILFTNNACAIKAYLSVGFIKVGNFRLSLLKK